MDSNGVRILVDLLTLAHLHTSRATVPLQVKRKRLIGFCLYFVLFLDSDFRCDSSLFFVPEITIFKKEVGRVTTVEHDYQAACLNVWV